jgi:hypothetical protein
MAEEIARIASGLRSIGELLRDDGLLDDEEGVADAADLIEQQAAEIERLTVRWAGTLPTEPGTYFMRSLHNSTPLATIRFHTPFVERDVEWYANHGWEFSTRVPEPVELEAK